MKKLFGLSLSRILCQKHKTIFFLIVESVNTDFNPALQQVIEDRGGYFSDTTLEFEYYSYDCFSIKNIHETDLSIYTDIKTTFDSCGNWISKICYIGDNPQVYYERTIEYY